MASPSSRTPPDTPERSMPFPLPRPERPNRPRWWHRPSSRSGRVPAPPQATQTGSHPGAASSPHTACAAACGGGDRAAWHAPPGRPCAVASSPTCNPTGSYAAPASARGNASRSSPGGGSDTPRASSRSRRPEPASPRPCPAAGRSVPPSRPPRSDPGNAETAAPTSPKPLLLPSPTVPFAPIGSKRPETSASCGPVATSSGSSLSLLTEAENRTTRVLPNRTTRLLSTGGNRRGDGAASCGYTAGDQSATLPARGGEDEERHRAGDWGRRLGQAI